jgi:hypothetical protein
MKREWSADELADEVSHINGSSTHLLSVYVAELHMYGIGFIRTLPRILNCRTRLVPCLVVPHFHLS